MSKTIVPKALLFDVFGTCVDWRSSVTNGLLAASSRALLSESQPIPTLVREKARAMDKQAWGVFAQDWRDSYLRFTKSLSGPNVRDFKTVDIHHFEALLLLLEAGGLEGLWTDDQLQDVNLLWHRLDPWPDSILGMKAFNTKFETATLSNGNVSLLQDLRAHSRIEWQHLFSGEHFGAYKPSPATYLGACEKLGYSPEACAMVAAHLVDLFHAKKNGLLTIYVERPLEEKLSPGEIEDAKKAGYVDVWVPVNGNGLLGVVERLGVDSYSVI
jgi:2-haloacid dehalogenase